MQSSSISGRRAAAKGQWSSGCHGWADIESCAEGQVRTRKAAGSSTLHTALQ